MAAGNSTHITITGHISFVREGVFVWRPERQISWGDAFLAVSPTFIFKCVRYAIDFRKNKQSYLIATTLYRTDHEPLVSLNVEFGLLAELEIASHLPIVTARDETSNCAGSTASIREFLSRRRGETYRGDLGVLLRLREEPPGGRQGAGAEVAEESNGDFEKDSQNENLKKLQEDFENLFWSKDDSDLTLKVKDKKIPAHRAILRARSPVFEAMFEHDMAEKRSGDVSIEDSDPETFQHFLHYLYTGSTERVSEENVCRLFTISDKYEVLLLKESCAEYMKSHPSVETFCDFVDLALKHAEEDLLRSATIFFSANAAEIVKTTKWQMFMAEKPTAVNEFLVKALSKGKNI